MHGSRPPLARLGHVNMASSPCARRRCAIADCAAGIFYQFVRGISQDLRRGPKSTSSAGAHRKRAAAGNKKGEVGVQWGDSIAGLPRGAGVRARRVWFCISARWPKLCGHGTRGAALARGAWWQLGRAFVKFAASAGQNSIHRTRQSTCETVRELADGKTLATSWPGIVKPRRAP